MAEDTRETGARVKRGNVASDSRHSGSIRSGSPILSLSSETPAAQFAVGKSAQEGERTQDDVTSFASGNRLPLESLLPLRAAVVTLRFTAQANLATFHAPALTGFLRTLLQEAADYDLHLTVDAPESGRTAYRAGDRYRFALYGSSGGENLLGQALQNLAKLPVSARRSDPAMPFRDNLVFEEARDLFTGRQAISVDQLTPYSESELDREAACWREADFARVRWLSPVRLLLEKERRAGRRGELRYCRDRREVSSELLCARAHDAFADLLRRRGVEPGSRGPAPVPETVDMDLFWVDSRYRDEQGNEQAMGGLMGVADLGAGPDRPIEFWRLWVLGQYLGIGQRRAFGWGRYRLEKRDGGGTLQRTAPTASLLGRAAEEENLSQAYAAIRANVRPPAKTLSDDEWPEPLSEKEEDEEPDDAPAERLARLGRSLAAGDYRPPSLKGVVVREPDGDLRALAVPPFFDRVAQRAVAQVLGAAIEPLLSRGSFGYRPRRSRHGAALAIRDAYREGYRWVFESDIEHFFDSVRWSHLHNRLSALFGDDPVVPLVLRWMSAPVEYRGQRIERSAGLPQGAPLSPLMANLMLDDFDGDLEAAGFRLIRFADDFVVLCKDRERAEEAARAARTSLAEIGLGLNAGKTRVTDFERGFEYLGYVFVNDMALDAAGERRKEPAAEPKAPAGWLAEAQRCEATPDLAENTAPISVQPGAGIIHSASAGEEGAVVYVTGAPALIGVSQGRLEVRRESKTLRSVPLSAVRTLVLIGPHHLTTPALKAALRNRLPVHFADSIGRYQGVLWDGQPGAEGAELWLLQAARSREPAFCLMVARRLVEVRLRHQREVLRQRDAEGSARDERAAMETLILKAGRAQSRDELNGLEGQGAKLYFRILSRWIPAEWGFDGRERRPPPDPFNVLLSLGYTILYAHAETSLRATGLLPWLGFYHQPHGRHATLASDLMEPFRHLVERTALAMATQGRLKPDDFTIGADGCRMKEAPRREYLAALTERFEKPIAGLDDQESLRLWEHLHRQNLRLIDSLRKPSVLFKAWCMR